MLPGKVQKALYGVTFRLPLRGRAQRVADRPRSGGPNPKGETAEGVDASASKKHLLDVARRLDVSGRSSMNKDELVDAIIKANRRESSRNR